MQSQTGLGGIGRPQLVLRYIEEREEEYDKVLWIDVWNEETTRASVEAALSSAAGSGVATEQRRKQGMVGRWDNADDLSWHVSGAALCRQAKTVIVTSQDAQASRLLGGRTPVVGVDAIESEEAVRLVSNYFDEHLCH